ncbi:hypothetical protein V8E54_005430 [Elaphomyces granulatus]
MSESSLNKGGHGAMSMQPGEIAAAEALTLLDAGTALPKILQCRHRCVEVESLVQRPEVYNQHDKEEKRLDQYIKAIREVRISWIAQCQSTRDPWSSLLNPLPERQAPKGVAERAYRDSMVEELSKYLLSGK